LDGDDVLMPWALKIYDRLITACCPELILGRSAKCLEKVPTVQTGEPSQGIQFVEYPDFLSKDRPWIYNTSSLIVHRATFLSAGGWSTDIFYQDIQDLLNKLGIAGKTVLVLAPETVWYRMHTTNAVRKVSPFIDGIYVLLAKARAGDYPGERDCWLRRTAWFGGLIFYWAKEALRAGLYRDGFKLLTLEGWLILLAVLRRGAAWTIGRRTIETLPVDQN
jgi:hypothetical protein